MGGTVTVENTLTSTSVANALSANQGRVLNEKIQTTNTKMQEIENRVTTLEESSGGGSSNDCITKIWS